MTADYSALLAVARTAAAAASDCMRMGWAHPLTMHAKGPGVDFATGADLAAERAVRAVCADLTPDIPVLGEEEGGALASRCWVVDPIDGTWNYARRDPMCGTQIALLEDGEPTVAVVALPFLNETYTASVDQPTLCNNRPVHVSTITDLGAALVLCETLWEPAGCPDGVAKLSLDRYAAVTMATARTTDLGSAAVAGAWLASGRADALVPSTQEQLWDVAPQRFIASRAGAVVMAGDGSRYVSGGQDYLIAAPGVADVLCELLRHRW